MVAQLTPLSPLILGLGRLRQKDWEFRLIPGKYRVQSHFEVHMRICFKNTHKEKKKKKKLYWADPAYKRLTQEDAELLQHKGVTGFKLRPGGSKPYPLFLALSSTFHTGSKSATQTGACGGRCWGWVVVEQP